VDSKQNSAPLFEANRISKLPRRPINKKNLTIVKKNNSMKKILCSVWVKNLMRLNRRLEIMNKDFVKLQRKDWRFKRIRNNILDLKKIGRLWERRLLSMTISINKNSWSIKRQKRGNNYVKEKRTNADWRNKFNNIEE
jgi:hypothetical protein